MIQLACIHCGHRFELEKQEGALCPSCGWSSSIVLASEIAQNKASSAKKKSTSEKSSWFFGFLIFVLKFLAFAGMLFLVVWMSLKFWNSHHDPFRQSQNKKASQKINLDGSKPQPLKPMAPAALSVNEELALNSKIEIPQEVQLDDADQKLLQQAVDLMSGNVEKLPSGSWTLDQFKKFVEQQEKVFHMPLPRGYKKDLEELFQKTYAKAYDLFLAGKTQESRDAYVAALGFPVYENDVRKHRAVVLTMLRSFVNDTIAKIGSMNFALARQRSNGLAEQVSAEYAGLQQQIRASQWSVALNAIEKMEVLLPDASSVTATLQAPTYVTGFEKVDGDIQPVLLKLLQVPAWTFDPNDLKNDLDVKKTLLFKLTDPDRKSSLENYNQALEKIKIKSWAEAVAFLQVVKSPAELKQDADQKIELIGKLTGGLPAAAS